MITASRFVLVAAALGVSGLIQAQAPAPRNTTSPSVVEVSPGARASDPERAKVERADDALKAFEGAEITDPTVFVKSAALGGMTGSELAKLAQSKSQDASIRSFAGRMLKDHDALHRELAAIAKRKRLDVPTSLVYEDEQLVTEATEKTGAEFDAWYARQMVTENQKAVALFQAAAKMQDAELAAFAKKTLPALEEHQRMAIALSPAARP
jgi:putative membrane protein